MEMLSFNNMMWEGYKEAIKMADLPDNSYGFDAGCGPGGIEPLLAEGIGHNGRILGLDYTPEHVEHAREVKAKYLNQKYPGLHVEIGRSDFNKKPLQYTDAHGKTIIIEDNTFDWVWSCDTLCPGIFLDPQKIFSEFVRVTKPGGKIILFYGNDRTILLPGYQRLEAQLFEMVHFPDLDLKNGGSLMIQTDTANVWMKNAGLKSVVFKTLSVEKHGSVKERDEKEKGGVEENLNPEKPEYGDLVYLDFQLSDMFLNSLRDLHNGYDFPILNKNDKSEYFPFQSDYYFRLTPQVNIGVMP
jgi:SAM-dependent methyltransferase